MDLTQKVNVSIEKVLCLNLDSGFVTSIEADLARYAPDPLEVVSADYESNLIKLIQSHRPPIVFVNASDFEAHWEHFFFEQSLWASFCGQGAMPIFVAVFSDAEMVWEKLDLLGRSFFYFMIQGEESTLSVREICYLTFDLMKTREKFATARMPLYPVELKLSFAIRGFNQTGVMLSSDLIPSNPLFNIDLGERQRIRKLTLRKTRSNSLDTSFANDFFLEVPEKNVWADQDEFNREQLKRWQSAENNPLAPAPCYYWVYSAQLEPEQMANVAAKMGQLAPARLVFFPQLAADEARFDLAFHHVGLIFFDMDEAENNIVALEALIQLLKGDSANRKVILIISGTQSKSEAFQKLYSYPHILCMVGALKVELIEKLISSHVQKPIELASSTVRPLPPFDERATSFFSFEAKLHSLSERAISFYTKEALPFYTVLCFDIGIKFLFTIVPPLGTIESGMDGTLYVGFIHGIDEAERMQIRRLVNQIIYRPFDEFTKERVLGAISLKAPVKAKEEVPEQEEKDEDKTDISLGRLRPEPVPEIKVRKRRTWANIKSKL